LAVQETPDRTEARIRIAVQVAALAMVGYEAWVAFAPEHTRTRMRMRACDMARRAALRAARWAARQGIAVEVRAGAKEDAAPWYACARWLAATAAGPLQAAYDRARGQ
jgi:hypothetical protein